MDKKKITAIVIAGAVLLFIIAVDLFLIMSKKQDPVESLQKSIGYADGKLQFTIPETYNDSWYIQISGRTQMEEGGRERALSGRKQHREELGEKQDLFL